jgi:hypothetical protein
MDEDQTDVGISVENIQLADSDMLVDEYEQYKDGKADVVLVSPPDSLEEQEIEPLADDCMEYPLEIAAGAVRKTPLAGRFSPPPVI